MPSAADDSVARSTHGWIRGEATARACPVWVSPWGAGSPSPDSRSRRAAGAPRPGRHRRFGCMARLRFLTAVLKPLMGRRLPSLSGSGPGVGWAFMRSTHGSRPTPAGSPATSGRPCPVHPRRRRGVVRVQTRRHFASDVAVGVLAGYLGGGSLGLIIRRKVGRTVAFTAPRRSDGGRLGALERWDPGLRALDAVQAVGCTADRRNAGRSCCDGIAAGAHG